MSDKFPRGQGDRKHEISEAEREAVSQIERLPIPVDDKVTMLLVWKGLKSAQLFSFCLKQWDKEKGEPPADEERAKELQTILETIKSLELVAEYIVSLTPDLAGFAYLPEGRRDEQYAIARTPEHAHAVAREQRKQYQKGEIADQYALGIALGYPETAVRAWEEYYKAQRAYRKKIDDRVYPRGPFPNRYDYLKDEAEIPETIKRKPFFIFNRFYRLSKDHWREELETAMRWTKEIKRLSPKLYQEYLEKKG